MWHQQTGSPCVVDSVELPSSVASPGMKSRDNHREGSIRKDWMMRTSKGTGFGPGWHETHINSKPNVGSRVSTCVALQEVSNIEPNGGDSTGTTVDGSGFHMQCGGKERLLNTVVQAPLQYIQSMGGKKVRARAAQAFNAWLEVDEEDLRRITNVIDLLHNASLILDDLEDGSTSRRGRPAAHVIFGMPQAINSSGFQINKALKEVAKLGGPCLDIFSEEMEKLYIGQGYDLYWSFHNECPTYEDYISMVDYKTGALFHMLVKLMCIKSHTSQRGAAELLNLVTLIGRYFQIRDDYMNLTSDEYTDQKGFCDDLDEGKFSIILIHALENAKEADRSVLRHILAQRHKAEHMPTVQKHKILEIFKRTASLKFAILTLQEIGRKVEKEVASLEAIFGMENTALHVLLDMLKI